MKKYIIVIMLILGSSLSTSLYACKRSALSGSTKFMSAVLLNVLKIEKLLSK